MTIAQAVTDTDARATNLTAFFDPRHIAVVGASPGKSAYSNLVLKNLKVGGYGHRVSVIHPKYQEVDGFPSYPSLTVLDDRPDLVVIAIRADLVPAVLRECVARDVPAVTIIAAGFAEQGSEDGIALQRDLADIVKGSGTRVLGPNCLGIAAFATGALGIASGNIPETVAKGPLAIVSQSGGVGLAIMLRGLAQGMRINYLASLGNELDVSVSDVIAALAEADDVSTIVCYIEGVRHARRFREALEACNRAGKPVIILRGGVTSQGKKAAASHTGAISGDGAIWQGFLAQVGAIQAKSIDHAIAAARLFLDFGPAGGESIAGFGGGGGLTVLFTDMLSSQGIPTPPLQPETRRLIREALPDVEPHNPMEMGGLFLSGDGTALERALRALSADPGISALVLCVPPYLPMRDQMINGAIVRAIQDLSKPAIILSYAHPAAPSVLKNAGAFILEAPEAAMLGIKSWLDHTSVAKASGRTGLRGEAGTAAAVLKAALDSGEDVVLEDKAKDLLRAYGVACPAEAVAGDREAAAKAARELGYPVALKILAPDMLHRGIGKGVLLNIADEPALLAGFDRLAETSASLRDARILVQAMARAGMEFLVGAARDPEIGLALAIGMGGVNVEAKREVLFCVPPISRDALRNLLDGWPALAEAQHRHGPIDMEALLDQLVRIARLLDDAGDMISEADVNPIIVGAPGSGAVAVDALIVLQR